MSNIQISEIFCRLQGYSEIPIPSHRKIQQCLVDIGDKPSSFIGSKQWIGSTEVSFVLQTLLNIETKILCASSGEEMLALIPQLADHFDTHGTPVMIGMFSTLRLLQIFIIHLFSYKVYKIRSVQITFNKAVFFK